MRRWGIILGVIAVLGVAGFLIGCSEQRSEETTQRRDEERMKQEQAEIRALREAEYARRAAWRLARDAKRWKVGPFFGFGKEMAERKSNEEKGCIVTTIAGKNALKGLSGGVVYLFKVNKETSEQKEFSASPEKIPLSEKDVAVWEEAIEKGATVKLEFYFELDDRYCEGKKAGSYLRPVIVR